MTRQDSPVSGTTTYLCDEYGELITETNARGVTSSRSVGVLDRVTAVTYPDSSLNILYTYDDPTAPFSKGRLTRIARPDSVIDYRYDRFGRLLQDGDLGFTWDANGNAATIVYPGDVPAGNQEDLLARINAILEPGGVLFLREADAGAGSRFVAVRIQERFAALLRGHWRQKYRYRSAAELKAMLKGLGMTVEIQPMGMGTPYGNVLLVGRTPVRDATAP